MAKKKFSAGKFNIKNNTFVAVTIIFFIISMIAFQNVFEGSAAIVGTILLSSAFSVSMSFLVWKILGGK